MILKLLKLYSATITTINTRDYNKEHTARASTANRTESLTRKMREQKFYVAQNEKSQITGFASLENNGHLDMMYVHQDFQDQGIAKTLLQTIVEKAESLGLIELETDASKTAQPFFEKQGFEMESKQTVYINNVELVNYKMRRILL